MTDNVTTFQIPPVEKSILVPCAPDRAFRAFTAEIGQWWPLSTHSVAQGQARGVAIEPRIGGRVFETDAAGGESDWGRVLEWAPPHRLVMTWHPGRTAASEQTVEINFVAEGADTRVILRHHGWENLGIEAARARDLYNNGWDMVLAGRYGDFCKQLR
ncbi:MAG TPA: SRPBCC family protein [Dongiaceae bacterium]|nr:SRPBCC family protein [Dongiaceae bacterium]